MWPTGKRYTGRVRECARFYEYIIVDRGVAWRMRRDYGRVVLSER